MYVNLVRNHLRSAVSYIGQRDEVLLMHEPVEGRAHAETVSHNITFQSKDKDGNNRVAVEATYKVQPDSMLLGRPVAALIREAVNKEVGNMAEGLGRIVAIDHLAVDTPDLARRFGDAEPFVVTAHVGIMFRTG
jgi:hypothetical protein